MEPASEFSTGTTPKSASTAVEGGKDALKGRAGQGGNVRAEMLARGLLREGAAFTLKCNEGHGLLFRAGRWSCQ